VGVICILPLLVILRGAGNSCHLKHLIWLFNDIWQAIGLGLFHITMGSSDPLAVLDVLWMPDRGVDAAICGSSVVGCRLLDQRKKLNHLIAKGDCCLTLGLAMDKVLWLS